MSATRRFVLLRHEGHGAVHFDFMIEAGAALATWELATTPALLAPGASLSCRRLADHRTAYLDYEGPVGGDRGAVTRIAIGTCTLHATTATDWDFELHSPTLAGHCQLHNLTSHEWILKKLSAA